MKTLIKCMILATATFCFSDAYATTMQDNKPVPIKNKPNHVGTNAGPLKAPSNIPCPVSATYDDCANVFTLYGADNLVVAYTIYDEYENELQTGTVTIVNGTATITVTGSALADGSTIELTINAQTFVGTVEP